MTRQSSPDEPLMPNTTLIDQLVLDLTPVKPVTPWRFMGVMGIGLALSIGLILLAVGAREDLHAAMMTPMFWWKIGSMTALAIAAGGRLYAAALPGRQPASLWTWALWATVASLVLGVATQFFDTGVGGHLNDPMAGMHCLTWVIAASMPVLTIGLFWVRSAAPTRPGRAALLTGLTSGAIGAVAFAVHCPYDLALYVVTWYSLAIGAVTALAYLAGRRWLRW